MAGFETRQRSSGTGVTLPTRRTWAGRSQANAAGGSFWETPSARQAQMPDQMVPTADFSGQFRGHNWQNGQDMGPIATGGGAPRRTGPSGRVRAVRTFNVGQRVVTQLVDENGQRWNRIYDPVTGDVSEEPVRGSGGVVERPGHTEPSPSFTGGLGEGLHTIGNLGNGNYVVQDATGATWEVTPDGQTVRQIASAEEANKNANQPEQHGDSGDTEHGPGLEPADTYFGSDSTGRYDTYQRADGSHYAIDRTTNAVVADTRATGNQQGAAAPVPPPPQATPPPQPAPQPPSQYQPLPSPPPVVAPSTSTAPPSGITPTPPITPTGAPPEVTPMPSAGPTAAPPETVPPPAPPPPPPDTAPPPAFVPALPTDPTTMPPSEEPPPPPSFGGTGRGPF